MKKILLLIVSLLLFSGCSKINITTLKNELKKRYEKSSGYKLDGELEINNNDDIYHYNIEVFHKKDDLYRIELVNKDNDFKQIILKNPDGVFLYTPSLNKSFKFQSDWPYNHSQIYLLGTIINDIEKDNNANIEVDKNKIVVYTKVDYPNNKNLSKQKIIFDNNYNLKNVTVYNNNDQVCMEFSVSKLKYSPKISNDEFLLDNVLDNNEKNEEVKETSVLDDIIYPLFVPNGTKLVDEEKVVKDGGERVIMTYDGEKSFLLVEETQDVFDELTIIPTSGEPYQLMDTIGVMTDNSLSWSSGGMDYYLVSDVMSQQELLEVAESIVGIPSMK